MNSDWLGIFSVIFQAYKYFLAITTSILNLCLRDEPRFEGKVKSLNRNCDFGLRKTSNIAWLLKLSMSVHSKNVCSRESGSLQKKHLSSDLILHLLSSFFFFDKSLRLSWIGRFFIGLNDA